ncbi:MAG: BCAM0308 family protein [Thermodesulfobacteriota bacterium]
MKGARYLRRKSIDTQKDPYLSKASPDDMSSCTKCGAVYHDKRWMHRDDARGAILKATGKAVLCPACQKTKDGFARGFVTIQGEFVKDHREEILNLVRNKEALASHTNPLERIMEVLEREGTIEITTTTEKLAQRIGRMLSRTFSGSVEYKWSSDVKLARVVWTR